MLVLAPATTFTEQAVFSSRTAFLVPPSASGSCAMRTISRVNSISTPSAASRNSMHQLSFKRHRLPPDIIRRTIWLYAQFTLGFHVVKELIAERSMDAPYENISLKGPMQLRKPASKSPFPGWKTLSYEITPSYPSDFSASASGWN